LSFRKNNNHSIVAVRNDYLTSIGQDSCRKTLIAPHRAHRSYSTVLGQHENVRSLNTRTHRSTYEIIGVQISAATSSAFSRKILLFRGFSAFFLSFLLSSFFSAF
jgi:hypothetical protein